MAGYTNRGKYLIQQYAFRTASRPTNYYIILWTSATAPTADTNVVSDHTQIATGNGYADGGFQLTPGDTDFDSHVENDTNDRDELQIKDVAWTASGGPIPSSGNGARYAGLTDDNATVANRQVFAYWDLGSDRSVSNGQTLTLQNLELRLTEA